MRTLTSNNRDKERFFIMAVAIGKRVLSYFISFFASLVKNILIVPKGTCRYYPSCTEYAQEAIENLSPWKAIIKISIRLLKCNPLFRGGYDPVISVSRKGKNCD
jgi:uncharacterized protein